MCYTREERARGKGYGMYPKVKEKNSGECVKPMSKIENMNGNEVGV